jgi:hypothetical protein
LFVSVAILEPLLLLVKPARPFWLEAVGLVLRRLFRLLAKECRVENHSFDEVVVV